MMHFILSWVVVFFYSGGYSAFTQVIPHAQSHPDSELARASRLESIGSYHEAKNIYLQLYEFDQSDKVFGKVMSTCEMTSDFATMERLAQERLEKTPNNIMLMRYLAKAKYGQGDKKNSRAVLLSILDGRFNDIQRVYLVAAEFIAQNDYETGLSVYLSARKEMKKNTLFSMEIARIYLIQKEYEKAVEEYCTTLDTITVTASAIRDILKKVRESGVDIEKVSRPLQRHFEQHPKSIDSARLLSDIQYQLGNRAEAYHILFSTAVSTNNPLDIWNFAKRAKNDGDILLAIDAFEDYYRSFTKDPKRPNALFESAEMKWSTGDSLGAYRDFEHLVHEHREAPESSIAKLRLIELARSTMTFDKFAESLLTFASATAERTASLEAYMLLGESFMKRGDAQEAHHAFDQALLKARSDGEYYVIALNSALLNFFTGTYKDFSKDIETCIKHSPIAEEINDLLMLKMLGMQCSTSADVRAFEMYAHGLYEYYKGNNHSAVDSLTVVAADSSTVVAPHAALALGELTEREHRYEESIKWYRSATNMTKDAMFSVGALLAAGDIYAGKINDKRRARSLYLDALTLFPHSVYDATLRRKVKEVSEE